MTETVHLTTQLLWKSTLVAMLIDAPLLFLVARGVSADLFRRLRWYLVAAAFLVYAGLWGTYGSVFYWESVYKAIFPAWSRWLLAPGYGLLFAVLALAFWRISLLAVKRPVLMFCLLGGLMSLVGHSIGISRGLMRVPMLAEASAASALVFGFFEFIFYWCAIVGISLAGRWLGKRMQPKNG